MNGLIKTPNRKKRLYLLDQNSAFLIVKKTKQNKFDRLLAFFHSSCLIIQSPSLKVSDFQVLQFGSSSFYILYNFGLLHFVQSCSGRIQKLWMLTNFLVLSSRVLQPKDFQLLLLEEGPDDYQYLLCLAAPQDLLQLDYCALGDQLHE